jgi:hypothetical protein
MRFAPRNYVSQGSASLPISQHESRPRTSKEKDDRKTAGRELHCFLFATCFLVSIYADEPGLRSSKFGLSSRRLCSGRKTISPTLESPLRFWRLSQLVHNQPSHLSGSLIYCGDTIVSHWETRERRGNKERAGGEGGSVLPPAQRRDLPFHSRQIM